MASIVQYAYIEVTRRCNMFCAHYCQRGFSENIDLSKEDFDTFLSNFTHIEYITLGGGEPTLNPDMIEYIIDKIIEKRIVVGYLGMVTNGQIYNEKVANAFNRFDEYNKKLFDSNKNGNEYISGHVGIAFSVDSFHMAKESVVDAYKQQCPWILITNQTIHDENIIKTGFATFGKEFHYVLPLPMYQIMTINNTPCLYVKESINISANGYINTYAEGTYSDHDKYNFGHVSNFSLVDFLIKYGIPARTPDNNRTYMKEFYLSVLKEVLYKMGCDKNIIYQLTGMIEDRVSYTPVYKKVSRYNDICKKSH